MNDIFCSVAQFVQYVDSTLLLGLNGLHNPVLDTVMRTVSCRTVWIPLYLLLFALVWRRYGLKGAILCLLTTLLAVTLADQLCGSWLRSAVGRLRPSNPDNPLSEWVHLVNNYRGGKYGFPSCHAANTAVVAITLSLWLRRRALMAWLLGWSALVSLSRPGRALPGRCAGWLRDRGRHRLRPDAPAAPGIVGGAAHLATPVSA